MGGGTGIYPVVSSLNRLNARVTAVVAASDSGGSTGRIRDEFGFPPVGDLRQSLAALADDQASELIRSLLLYRFEKGNGLKGHNLGNIILTALQDMTGSTTKALAQACQIFRIDGQVIPVTEKSVELKITYADGSQIIGEHTLDAVTKAAQKIDHVELTPPCTLNPAAKAAITKAQWLIIGPGDLYASLLAVLVTPGMKEVIQQSNIPVLYISNLMTRAAQTADMTARDHLEQIETAIGKPVDQVLVHQGDIALDIIEAYAKEHEFPVVDDLGSDPRVKRVDLLKDTRVEPISSDSVRRSLLRHSAEKLESSLKEIINI